MRILILTPKARSAKSAIFAVFDKKSQQQQRNHYDTDLVAVVTTPMGPPHPTRVVCPVHSNPRDHPGVETDHSDLLIPVTSQYQDTAMGSNNNPNENHPSNTLPIPPVLLILSLPTSWTVLAWKPTRQRYTRPSTPLSVVRILTKN